ncbi:Subtilase family protein [Micromonospora pallida]|uniref:Subtilase family protein n=1 Tax=Micromonospora pallida TaxID=145854 RepID=A0A1C6T5R1_9ACTN|nr:S8 family serine peptidase [Micromonospora pallida]SCL37027.1 Subtilase family protein [Micromonospora pallida]
MRQRRLLAYGALGATLATVLVGVPPAAARPTATPSAPPALSAPAASPADDQEPTRRLTLFTGDRVTVRGKEVTVAPREGVHFVRLQRDRADYVIPSDAIPLLKADRLDERLFNVTALLEFGFDELSYLPLVVSDATAVRGLATGPELEAVDGFATRVPRTDLAKTWQTTKSSLTRGKIWADGVRKSSLDTSVPMIGTPAAWSAGYDGTGVKVAVLDSGIDDTHPDLAGKVVARRNFIPEIESALDLNGHGTHVSSTIAGSGAASGGKYKGVAPGATLLDGKVCWNVEGRGSCSDSAILAAMQWAAESGATVVNMSLGTQDTIGVDPLEQAVNDLTAEYGTLFVVAAGNYNGWQFRVGSPSTADAALSVANFDKAGELNWSSLRGPRIGDFGVKPDIGGPGTEITAARSPSALGHLPAGSYFAATGTSMAAPHVAGAAALLAQAHPGWHAAQFKEALMATASPNPAYDVFAQGAGFVDVAKALSQPVTVTPASLSLGVLEWPHTEDPTVRTMTYHNRGDQPVTLDLALDGDAPAGLLTLSARTLTVPAGGDATVQVTVDERASTSYGLYKGRLVATGGAVKLQTPFSVYHEEPAAGLKVSAIGADGNAPATVMVELVNPDPQNYASHTFYTSSASVRVPLNSSWRLSAYIENPDGTIALLTHNRIVADADQEVVLDARKARPLDITVPDTRAQSQDASVMVLRGGDRLTTYAGVTGELDTIRTADVGPADLPGLATQVHAAFQGPARTDRAPDVYQLGWRIKGSFITGLVRHVSRGELATVDAQYAQNATGVAASRTNTTPDPDVSGGGLMLTSELPAVATPGRRTEYYNGAVQWRSVVREETVAGGLLILDLTHPQAVTYQPGRDYVERWNGAVLQTTLTPQYGSPLVTRQGNAVRASLTDYADGAGHVGLPYSMTNHRFTLHRGDTLVGEYNYLYGSWEVAAEPTTYRMRYELDLPEPYRLSRRLETEWTFTTSAAQEGALPLTSIGFQPALALDNSAQAGKKLDIPLTFAQQATAGRITSADVSVSYDDGRTWTAVRTTEKHGQYTATVQHPKGTSGFVSLRATAVDSAGNTVTTTVYRAYQLR